MCHAFRRAAISFLAALCLALTPVASFAEAYQQTYSLRGLMEYTLYDSGRMSISEDQNNHTHYPKEGGMLMVQCDPINFSFSYEEESVYSVVFPGLTENLLSSADKSVKLSDKRFVCNGYYALQFSYGYVLDKTNVVRDDAYFIATPKHIFSIHFVNATTLGNCPRDNLPYILASLNFPEE